MVSPVIEIWDAYEPSRSSEVEEVVGSFSTDAILAAVNERLPQLREALSEIVDKYNEWHPLPPQLYRRLDEVWKLVLNDDGGWENALAEVSSAGVDLVESNPSGLGSFVKGGAVGYAGAALLGPLGWLAAAAVSHFSDKDNQEKFERAIERWDAATKGLMAATERWWDAAADHLRAYFDDVAKEIDRAIAESADVADPAQPLLLMQSDLAESSEDEPAEEDVRRLHDRTPGINSNTCPICNHTYPKRVRWCKSCEVAL